jgi:DNA-binding MarR family transcriptional regulator
VAAPESVASSATFLLGKLAGITTARFAERIADFGLRPRHCGVLEWLGAAPTTQLDLARALGVTPSVIVDMLDELEALDAVRRNRDPADRRRQIVELTPVGRALITKAAHAAHQVEAELLAHLAPARRADLLVTLRQLAEENGFPTGSPAA